ncbi:MAG: hypothetical protein ACQES2_04155 [Pseudomonadota bacterium]
MKQVSTKEKASKALRGHFQPVKKISVKDITQMYQVFEKYYDGADLKTFIKDLSDKSGAVLIRRRSDNRIVGFSTVKNCRIDDNGRKAMGIFSGDTILEKEYWGSTVLQVQFFLYVVRQRLKYPLTPLFWLLISKGYKTYLIMANGFPEGTYFPSRSLTEAQNARYRNVAEDYCERLFPGYYNRETGLLDFGEQYQNVKGGVADISGEMRDKYPKIDFFETVNPTWRRGTELPCVGDVAYLSVVKYVGLLFRKILGMDTRARNRAKVAAAAKESATQQSS